MGKRGPAPSFSANPLIRLDPEDRHQLEHPWYVIEVGVRRYAMRRKGRQKVYLHREVTGCPPGRVVDHLNGDGLDNRRLNLKVCSQSINMLREFPEGGVYRKGNRWVARICGRYLGCFKDESEARATRRAEWERLVNG